MHEPHGLVFHVGAEIGAENPASREQIERKLTEQGLEEAGQTAAYHCQDTALKLKPWMTPPCWLRTARDVKAALREALPDAHGNRRAGELVERLLAAGLSRYEPDPVDALERAEQSRLQ